MTTEPIRLPSLVEQLDRTPRGKAICPGCRHTGWGENWWRRHRLKPHVPCPYPGCGLAFYLLDRHLAAHYWKEIKPMINEQ